MHSFGLTIRLSVLLLEGKRGLNSEGGGGAPERCFWFKHQPAPGRLTPPTESQGVFVNVNVKSVSAGRGVAIESWSRVVVTSRGRRKCMRGSVVGMQIASNSI